MSELKNFFNLLHNKTKRDYQARATERKAEFASIAKKFERDYWDGSRDTGYGGYYNDGRWRVVAEKIVSEYGLNSHSKILDVGCGKGFLLAEIVELVPGIKIAGIDVSSYAIENADEKVRSELKIGNACKLEFTNHSFDLVISINTLHNLPLRELIQALQEIQRVSKKDSYICVESYRNETEKWNLMRWQLTCEAFYDPQSWKYMFSLAAYSGDFEFIYFE